MKRIFLPTLLLALFSATAIYAQDKSKRPSPPALVSETTASGLTITIDYSQPSVKGRSIGKEIAPYGEVWRTGANEATVFEINKNATIDGKSLAAGKYGLYSVPGEKEWTIIFNKTWKQWGTNYTENDDALRIKVTPSKSKDFTEKMTFSVNKDGRVTLLWGDTKVGFAVK
ncbi:MAG TPA: DUF2911 domain-containing protein [Chitinophagaceae bacterium]|nr:DUF2911 domain-containing protein [Chitinophagaceae bacterium]